MLGRGNDIKIKRSDKRSSLFLCLMHSQLREWERDTLRIECSIYILVHVEVHTPIVGSIHPYTDGDVHAAVCQSSQFDEWCRVFQDTAILADDFHNGRLGQFEVCTIFHTEREIHTASPPILSI